MKQVGVQYSVEEATVVSNNPVPDKVVIVSTLYFDHGDIGTAIPTSSHASQVKLHVKATKAASNPEYDVNTIPHFWAHTDADRKTTHSACRAGGVIVPLGRVLNSPPRPSSKEECVYSFINKTEYDKLGPIEIELGCP
jgi:hypothetical protein